MASFNAFGALATSIAYTEVYGSLQTGVVDGADAANTNYFNQKFYEVAPYWALVAWLNFSNPLIMSEKKFQSLSPQQQTILLEAGAKASVLQRRLTTASNNAKLGKLLAKGVKVGATVFVVSLIGQRSIMAITRKLLWPWISMVVVLLLVTYIPEIALYLPRVSGFMN